MFSILGAHIMIFTTTELRVSIHWDSVRLSNSPTIGSLAQMLQLWTVILTAAGHSLPFRFITCCSWGVKWEELSFAKAESPREGTLLAPGLWPPFAWPPWVSLIPWLPNKKAHFQNLRIKAGTHRLLIFHCAFFLCCLELCSMQQTQEEGRRGWGWEFWGFDSHSCVLQNQLLCHVPTNYTPHPPEEAQGVPTPS